MTNNKIIFTIDLDAFFAACEEKLDPSLKTKPVGIGHELGGRGIITTANYVARKFGIKPGMPIYKARLRAKNLVIVEPKYEFYVEVSEQVFTLIKQYSKDIEIGSIDECHIDMTEAVKESGMDVISLAKHIQKRVTKEIGMGVSIGISSNKNLSKIASGLDKPLGITTLFPFEIQQKLWPLPIRELMFVGAATEKVFTDFGLNSIEQVAKIKKNSTMYDKLYKVLGKRLDFLILSANGYGDDNIESEFHELKSIGKQKTFSVDVTTYEQAKDKLVEMVEFVCKRLQYRGLVAKSGGISTQGVTSLHINKSKQTTFSKFSDDPEYILGNILKLFDKWYEPTMKIRYLGVFVGKLAKKDNKYEVKQMTLDDYWFNNAKDEIYKNNSNKIKDIINRVNFNIKDDNLVFAETLNTKKYTDKGLNTNDRVKFKRWGEDDE